MRVNGRCTSEAIALAALLGLGGPSASAGGPTEPDAERMYTVAAPSADGSPSDAIFDARGLNPYREPEGLLPFEHVDPFTGNLLLTFTDLVLPGNAGFDLKIQRSYNSKIFSDYFYYTFNEDSWAGLGWSLHMGRVIVPVAAGSRAIIEMPDGSAHPVYSRPSATETMTRTFWIYLSAGSPTILKRSDGVVYSFGYVGNQTSGGRPIRYATRIEDPFGNAVDITYWGQTPGSTAPRDAIRTVTQHMGGGRYRSVHFTYDADKGSLDSMTLSDNGGGRVRTWYYDHRPLDHHPASPVSLLWRVRPPEGPAWTFGYQTAAAPFYELSRVTTPQGGSVSYTHIPFYLQYCSVNPYSSNLPILTRGLRSRTSSGVDVAPGTWTYSYAQGVRHDKTVVDGPACSGDTTYTFYGVGGNQGICDGLILYGWKIGAQESKVVSDGSTPVQTETYEWQASELLSSDSEPIGPYVQTGIWTALLKARTITRGGASYRTTHEYRAGNLNDYGRPWKTTEQGEAARVTTRDFQYGFAPYIINRLNWERVSVGGEEYLRDYAYDLSNGFVTATIPHGIPTSYGIGAFGNVGSVTNANGKTTTFGYDWGVASRVSTPKFTITRSINPDGTIASEQRRGFTTSFEYDDLFRVTRVTPPAGHPVTTAYDVPGSGGQLYTEERRGSVFTRTFLGGFGAADRTENAVGVKRDFAYDSCGRRTYDGYPHDGTNIGTRTDYDILGRIRKKTHPDSSFISFDYEYGTDVVIRNERDRITRQDWSHFGDPDGAGFLRILRDADGREWNYAYNGLGSLRRVTPPTGPAREWIYYGSGEAGGTPGLLKEERNPERDGPVRFAYDPAGNVRTKEDPQFGVATYRYDDNGRLTNVDRPGSPYATAMDYDESDNRTLLQNGFVRSAFAYDGGNRLTSRTDTLTDAAGARTFATTYTPDGNDNVARIDYPQRAGDAPGVSITYDYDEGNRVAGVRRTGASCPGAGCFAGSVLYHPSGAIASFTGGNGVLHRTTFDPQRYWVSHMEAGDLLDLSYSRYDRAGNVEDIHDGTDSRFDQHFGYDDLERLDFAAGVWGDARFGYDERGNRRSYDLPDCRTNYHYDFTTDRLSRTDGCRVSTFGYDRNGNQTSATGRSVTHTPDNMIETATVDGLVSTYRYDGDTHRKIRTVGGARSLFVHGPGGQLLSEFAEPCPGQLDRVRDYVYLGSRLLASVRPSVGPTTVSLDAAAATVPEEGGPHVAGVRVRTGSGAPTTCPINVSYATVDGTAVAPEDYTAVSGSFTFAAGTPHDTTRAVSLPIRNDALDEDDETLKLKITAVTGALLGDPSEKTVTIRDDDPLPEVFTSTVTVVELDTGQQLPAVFNVDLSAPSGRTVSVAYATADRDATAGADYTAASGVLTFDRGVTRKPVSVPVLGDLLDEDDETFDFVLGSPVNAILRPGPTRGVIVDDDPLPLVRCADRVRDPEGNDGPQPLAFPVTLDRPSGRVVSVRFRTEDVSTRAGADYIARDERVTFPRGATQIDVPVLVVGDRVYEPAGSEAFAVKLEEPVNVLLGNPSQCRGTIVDDDPFPSVSVGDCTRLEGRTCPFAVTLSNPSAERIGVDYRTTARTAADGVDFTPASGRLEFEPETGSPQTVEVPMLADEAVEVNEDFLFDLSNPFNVAIADGRAVGTIIDGSPALFHPVTPCRVLDTRQSGGAVAAGTERSFVITSNCGVPASAKGVALNVTAAAPTAVGNLRLYAAGLPLPPTSVLNFTADSARANNATVLLGAEGALTVRCDMAGAGSTHVVVDVFGYYEGGLPRPASGGAR